jgi:hypothetical protein
MLLPLLPLQLPLLPLLLLLPRLLLLLLPLLEFDAFSKVSQTSTGTGTQRVQGGVMDSERRQVKDCRGISTRDWITRKTEDRTEQRKPKQKRSKQNRTE